MKKLGFDMMHLPLLNKESYEAMDLNRLKNMVDLFIENGYTYFETAFGNSETAFRIAVSNRYERYRYTVADRMPSLSIYEEKELDFLFEKQLNNLGVEFIDYYWICVDHYTMKEEMLVFDFAKRKKAEGKIRHIGVYCDQLCEKLLVCHPEIEYVEFELSDLSLNDSTEKMNRLYDVASKYRRPFVVFDSKNKDVTSELWSIHFANVLPNVMMVLMAMNNEDQVKEKIKWIEGGHLNE